MKLYSIYWVHPPARDASTTRMTLHHFWYGIPVNLHLPLLPRGKYGISKTIYSLLYILDEVKCQLPAWKKPNQVFQHVPLKVHPICLMHLWMWYFETWKQPNVGHGRLRSHPIAIEQININHYKSITSHLSTLQERSIHIPPNRISEKSTDSQKLPFA